MKKKTRILHFNLFFSFYFLDKKKFYKLIPACNKVKKMNIIFFKKFGFEKIELKKIFHKI